MQTLNAYLKKLVRLTLITALVAALWPMEPAVAQASVTQWGLWERTLTTAQTHHWQTFPVQATFTHSSGQILNVDGFYNGTDAGGQQVWVVRFTPTLPGTWSWSTSSADANLRASGTLQAVAPTPAQIAANPNLRGHLRVANSGPRANRYFTYADGTPFFWIGETAWEVNAIRAGIGGGPYDNRHFYTWLADRVSKGFTVAQTQFFFLTNRNEGGYPFPDNAQSDQGNGDFETLNASHFQQLDTRFRAMFDNGLVIAAHPSWLSTYRMSITDARLVSRYLMARYGAYNLVWSLSGEYQYKYPGTNTWDDAGSGGVWGLCWDYSTNRANASCEWNQLGQAVQSYNVYQHPVTIHPSGRPDEADPPEWGAQAHAQSSSGEFHAQPWLTFNWTQTRHYDDHLFYVFERTRDDYALTPIKPTVHSEGFYENNRAEGADAYEVRWQMWTALVNGAAGHTYGAGGLSHFYDPHAPAGETGAATYDATSWDAALAYPGAGYVKPLRDFFAAIPWWQLEPNRQALRVDGSAPAGPSAYDITPPHAASIPNQLHVIYLPRGNAGHLVQMTGLGTGAYIAQSYNPRSGSYTTLNGGSPINPTNGVWTVPASVYANNEDWVLRLTASSGSPTPTTTRTAVPPTATATRTTAPPSPTATATRVGVQDNTATPTATRTAQPTTTTNVTPTPLPTSTGAPVTACAGSGATRSVWSDLSVTTLNEFAARTDNFRLPASSTQTQTTFESPTDSGDYYGQRMQALLCVPVSGEYTFWLASDDLGVLLLNPTRLASPTGADVAVLAAGAAEIAGVPYWTHAREWSKYPTQQSSRQSLPAGWYYIEARAIEGWGGDNLAVAWRLNNVNAPTEGDGSFIVSQANLYPINQPPTTPAPQPTLTPTATLPQPTPAPGDSIRINFQLDGASIPIGYLADTGAVFGERGNGYQYGWNADNTDGARDRDSAQSPDQRYDTLLHMQRGGTYIWEIALPNGTYHVRLVAGDPSYYDTYFHIMAEAVSVVEGVSSTTQRWLEGEATVTVTDGRLTLSNPAPGSFNKVAFIEIAAADTPTVTPPTPAPTATVEPSVTPRPTATPQPTSTPAPAAMIKINFQKANVAVPAGYLADTGKRFGDRGNGQQYGWSANNFTGRDRNSAASPDQRYDTLLHMQKPSVCGGSCTWEIALPNGTYRVRLVAGDATATDSVFRLDLEGVTVIDGAPTDSQRWLDNTVTVTVSDGRLTLSNASGAQNNKVNFIEISSP
jgi:hypothetical protein